MLFRKDIFTYPGSAGERTPARKTNPAAIQAAGNSGACQRFGILLRDEVVFQGEKPKPQAAILDHFFVIRAKIDTQKSQEQEHQPESVSSHEKSARKAKHSKGFGVKYTDFKASPAGCVFVKFQVEQSESGIYTPTAGLSFVGHTLDRKTTLRKTLRKVVKRHGIPNVDLVRALFWPPVPGSGLTWPFAF